MRIKQYVYFALKSETIGGDVLGERIGLAPDRIKVRGSRMESPARPQMHSWEIVCDAPGLRVDEQVAHVLSRIRPHQGEIRECVATESCIAKLQVVRMLGAWLGPEEGEEQEAVVDEDGLEKLPFQHQLLGWHLDTEAMSFLLDVGADLDVDEYG